SKTSDNISLLNSSSIFQIQQFHLPSHRRRQIQQLHLPHNFADNPPPTNVRSANRTQSKAWRHPSSSDPVSSIASPSKSADPTSSPSQQQIGTQLKWQQSDRSQRRNPPAVVSKQQQCANNIKNSARPISSHGFRRTEQIGQDTNLVNTHFRLAGSIPKFSAMADSKSKSINARSPSSKSNDSIAATHLVQWHTASYPLQHGRQSVAEIIGHLFP
ncbi:hypothetical protein ACLOJK_040816, partial [Asimina triloba]